MQRLDLVSVSKPAFQSGATHPLPPEQRTLALTTYRSAKLPKPDSTEECTWANLLDRFRTHALRPAKDGAAFSFVRLKSGTTRASANVECLSAVVLDIDDGTPLEEIVTQVRDYEFLSVSTHSHTLGHPKYRMIFPLGRDVLPARWPQVFQSVNQLIGGHADPATKDSARLYYFPSCPIERKGDAFFHHNSGEWLDPDKLLKPRAAPRNAFASAAEENYPFGAGIISSPDEDRICGDGERTHHLTSLAGHWISQGLDKNALIEKARFWNSRNSPPLPDEKVVNTCESIWKTRERNRAASVPLQAPVSMSPSVEPSANVIIFPTAKNTERLFDLSEASVRDFLSRTPPPRRYLLKDCLPVGKVGAIIAPGGTGKSQFVLQIAISIASGVPLAGGGWEVGESGGVLALFAEDDSEEVRRRYYYTVKSMESNPSARDLAQTLQERLFVRSMVAQDNLMTMVHPANSTVFRTDYAERLINTVQDVPNLKLIIIDPASRFRGGNENSAEDMTRFVEALEYVSRQTGATVLVIHHANKSSMQGADQTQSAARGSSAFSDGLRWQINLSPMTPPEAKAHDIPDDQRHNYLSATITKNNYAAPQPPVFLRRTDGGVLVKADLAERAKRKEATMVLDIVQKIATSTERHSARSFTRTFGGLSNIYGMGQNALTGYINQAIHNGYLERGADSRGLLCVTTLGKTVLQARSAVQ